MTMNLKKNLRSVNKELNALVKKVDKLIVAVEKLEKTKAKTVKAKPKKKIAVKKPDAKKTTKTAIDTVFGIIKRYKKGVDSAALKKRTGFQDHKIHNIVYRLKNQGKIKSAGRGIYVKM